MHKIQLRHNFETAHRLSNPSAPQKCQSIHGHSWWVTVTLSAAQLDDLGMVVEFGAFKKAWRGFLDSTLDHHLVVRQGDPMAAAVRSVQPEARILELYADPTTEVLAQWLFERTAELLEELEPRARIEEIHVQETGVNAAVYGGGS